MSLLPKTINVLSQEGFTRWGFQEGNGRVCIVTQVSRYLAALTHSHASLAIFGGAGLWYNPGASVCPLVRPQCRITITLAHRDSRNRPKTANTAYRQRDSPSARKQASQTDIREVSNVSLFMKKRRGALRDASRARVAFPRHPHDISVTVNLSSLYCYIIFKSWSSHTMYLTTV